MVVVPSSRFTFSIASKTTRPVLKSRAPVGSSHNNTSGLLQSLLQWILAVVRHRIIVLENDLSYLRVRRVLKASSVVIGLELSSVTKETFSLAVRLGIRL